MFGGLKKMIKKWLNINQDNTFYNYNIFEEFDSQGNAIKNRIWYRGSSKELNEFYKQVTNTTLRFWGVVPTFEVRKIHTGLPHIIANQLVRVTCTDLQDIEFDVPSDKTEWDLMNKEIDFIKLVKSSLRECLAIGDGAYKLSIDPRFKYPVMEFKSGEFVDFKRDHGKITEVIFTTAYISNSQTYYLREFYGYGYIKNKLYNTSDDEVSLSNCEETKELEPLVQWSDKKVMLALPLIIFESNKYEGRGQSIVDGKEDAFDSLDEAWSQWIQALRDNRTKQYIPESLIPRDKQNGELIKPNGFDNKFIKIKGDFAEGSDKIVTENGVIPSTDYLQTYITALDLCLQGLISPSTLGIDTKKLDNAEAQREKEKTTLYTRGEIVDTLQEILPKLIELEFKCNDILNKRNPRDVICKVPFGDYASPSFEATIETMAKARPGQTLIPMKQALKEIYGNDMEEDEIDQMVAELKAEQGYESLDEPKVNVDAKTGKPLEDEVEDVS